MKINNLLKRIDTQKVTILLLLLVTFLEPVNSLAQDVFSQGLSKEELKAAYSASDPINQRRYKVWAKLSQTFSTGFGQAALTQQQNFFRFLDEQEYFKLPPSKRPFFWAKYQKLYPGWMNRLVETEGLVYVPFPDPALDPQVAQVATYAYSRLGGEHTVNLVDNNQLFWNSFYVTAAKKLGLPLNSVEPFLPFEPAKLKEVVYNKRVFAKKVPALYELLYSRPIPSSRELDRFRVRSIESSDFDVRAGTAFNPEFSNYKHYGVWTKEELKTLEIGYDNAFEPIIRRKEADLLLENLGLNLNPLMIWKMPFIFSFRTDAETGEARIGTIDEDVKDVLGAIKGIEWSKVSWTNYAAVGGSVLATIGLSKYGGKALGEYRLWKGLKTAQAIKALDNAATGVIDVKRAQFQADFLAAAEEETKLLAAARAENGYGIVKAASTFKSAIVNSANEFFAAVKSKLGTYDQERIAWWQAYYLRLVGTDSRSVLTNNFFWAVHALDQGVDSVDDLANILRTGLTASEVTSRMPFISQKQFLALADKYPRGLPSEVVTKIDEAMGVAAADLKAYGDPLAAKADVEEYLRSFVAQPAPHVLRADAVTKAKGFHSALRGKSAIRHLVEFEEFFLKTHPDALRSGFRIDFSGSVAQKLVRTQDIAQDSDITILISYSDARFLDNFGGTPEGLQAAVRKDLENYITFHPEPERGNIARYFEEGSSVPLVERIKIADATNPNKAFNELIGLDELGEETVGLSLERVAVNRYGEIPTAIAQKDNGKYLVGANNALRYAKGNIVDLVFGTDALPVSIRSLDKRLAALSRFGESAAIIFKAQIVEKIFEGETLILKGASPGLNNQARQRFAMIWNHLFGAATANEHILESYNRLNTFTQLMSDEGIDVLRLADLKITDALIVPKSFHRLLTVAEKSLSAKGYEAYVAALVNRFEIHGVKSGQPFAIDIFSFYNQLIWYPHHFQIATSLDAKIALSSRVKFDPTIKQFLRTSTDTLLTKIDESVTDLARSMTINVEAEQMLQGKIFSYAARRSFTDPDRQLDLEKYNSFKIAFFEPIRKYKISNVGDVELDVRLIYQEPILNHGDNFTPSELIEATDHLLADALETLAADTIFARHLEPDFFRSNISNLRVLKRLGGLGECGLPACAVNPLISHQARTVHINSDYLVFQKLPDGRPSLGFDPLFTTVHEFVHTYQRWWFAKLPADRFIKPSLMESVTEYLAQTIVKRRYPKLEIPSSAYDEGVAVIEDLEVLFIKKAGFTKQQFLDELVKMNNSVDETAWMDFFNQLEKYGIKPPSPYGSITQFINENIILSHGKDFSVMSVTKELDSWLRSLLSSVKISGNVKNTEFITKSSLELIKLVGVQA